MTKNSILCQKQTGFALKIKQRYQSKHYFISEKLETMQISNDREWGGTTILKNTVADNK